ncbi:MAG: hypothetical protein NVSMB18_36440 [Acetobacteraceae bacterium]
MAIALVGSIGAASTGGVGLGVSPAWGAGENRTAGNLLVCWVGTDAGTTLPATPTGWSLAAQQVESVNVLAAGVIFYKVAAGADAAPTFAGVAGQTINAQLAEFSGAVGVTPLDQTASNSGTVSPITATAAAPDAAAGNLVIVLGQGEIGGALTSSHTVNNGVTVTATNNDAASGNHYTFGYGITTGKSAADSDSLAIPGTSSLVDVLASFKASALGGRQPQMIL